MACLTENQLMMLFSPERTPALVAEADAHTATCAKCRELVAQFAQMSSDNGTAHTRRHDSSVGSAVAPSLTPGFGEHGTVPEQPPIAPPHALKLVGTVLKGKWRIERLLGYGGMAYVFAAVHRNGRRVAIKCMRPDLVTEPSLVERFLREGYVANKVEHPGTVAILDDDVMDDGTPFLVMELLTGRSLRQRLANGRLPLPEALDVTAAVLDVLAVAHDKGIVHRDLKPDNLFQTEDGAIKVLDFGIARLRERTRSQFETQTGTTMGTVGFMPPEQARGLTNDIDARSDVWAIGATLYSLLTGRSLHEATTANEALLLAMTTPVPPMRQLLPGIAPGVQDVMDRALAFKKEDRYPSARAMKEALEAARGQLAASAPAPPPATVVLGAFGSQPPPPMPIGAAVTPVPNATFPAIAPAEPTPSMLARAMARRGPGSIPPQPEPARADHKAWLVVGGAAVVAAFLGVGVVALVRGDAPARSGARGSDSAGTEPAAVVASAAPTVTASVSAMADPAPAASASAVAARSAVPSVATPPAKSRSTPKPAASAAQPVAATPTAQPTARPEPLPTATTPPPPATRDPLGSRR